MCGLTGSLEFEPATPPETLHRQIRAMAERLRHRGPDSDVSGLTPVPALLWASGASLSSTSLLLGRSQ